MPRVLVLLAALLFAPTAADAQTIRGVVIEDGTRTPVAGAAVELFGGGRRVAAVQTDSTGQFVLVAPRAGDLALRLSHVGYVTLDSVPLEVRRGEALELELRLSRRAIPLEPLVVTGRSDARLDAYRERLRRGGFGRFVTREEIDQRVGARASDLLRQISGVYLVPLPAPQSGNLIFMRGTAGQCTPTIYLDGMVVRQTGPVDDFLVPSMLEGVEVYTGVNAPSPIHSLSNCGVVAFWTRSFEGGSRFSWRRIAVFGGVVLFFVGIGRLVSG